MAIQMTRKEYEAKYGVAPVLNTSSLDTTPTPVRMTQEEYNQMYFPKEQTGLQKIGSQIKESFSAGTEKSKAGFEKITEAVGQIKDVKNPTQVKDLYKKVIRGELRFLGGAVDAAFAPLAPVFAPVGTGVNKVAEKIGSIPSVQRFASGDKGQEIIEKTQDVLDLVNISSVVPVGKLASGAASSISKSAPKAIETARVALKERAVNKLANEILNVENAYNKTAIKNTLSDDAGRASRQRIANTDVLTGLVDEDGKITFESAKNAADSYRKQTIDGAEGVVREIIKNEGKTVNLEQIKQILTEDIYSSGLQGSDLVSALNGVKKEIAGFKLRADEFGNLPLFIVHDSKIGATKYLDYTKPLEVSYRKALADSYRKIVENTSKANVEVGGKSYPIGGINKELGRYLSDIERIKLLGGKKVKGGRLGKYSSQIAGNIAGGAVGGVFGGPIGVAVGTVVGGEVGSNLRGKQMASTFGKAKGKVAPKSSIIESAVTKAKEGSVVDLKTPNLKVGAPKNIKKTKDIMSVEKQIAKNVEEQKKAIKAGNFTLVATLKEIYQALVIKLKNLIKEFKEIPNREGGFIDINGFSKADNQSGKGKLKSSPSSKNTTIPKVSQVENIYKGEKDLTTKILKELEGKTTVSKQYILDATNRGELKQVERDLIRDILQRETGGINKDIYTSNSPIKVFRGEGKGIGNSTLVNGQYFADSKKFASTFGDVTEEVIPKGSKIFDLDLVKSGQGGIPQEMLVDQKALTKYLIDNGVDYTKNTNTRGVEYVKLNKIANELDVLASKSKSLTDFKTKVMDNYDKYRSELSRLSKDYTNADHSRMRSPIEDIYNKIEREGIPTYKNPSDTINVKEFADKVKSELLPVKRVTVDSSKYEGVSLPHDIRGDIIDYQEHIYESPIATSAGDTHFSGKTKKYFGHTRTEDLPYVDVQEESIKLVGDKFGLENAKKVLSESEYNRYANFKENARRLDTKERSSYNALSEKIAERSFDDYKARKLAIRPTDKIRRVIEVQSDLYQKGNLEREGDNFSKENLKKLGSDTGLGIFNKNDPFNYKKMDVSSLKAGDIVGEKYGRQYKVNKILNDSDIEVQELNRGNGVNEFDFKKYTVYPEKRILNTKVGGDVNQRATLADSYGKKISQREQEVAKLQQYNDPTAHFRMIREEIKKASQDGKTKLQFPTGETAMKIEGLGQSDTNWRLLYEDIETPSGMRPSGSTKLKPENISAGDRVSDSSDFQWIITENLGDGKFKAVPNRQLEFENIEPVYKRAWDKKYIDHDTGEWDMEKVLSDKQIMEDMNKSYLAEQFDISGKVDTNNPIYKFYEKDVQKYLNKFGGKRVVDDKGVSWIEIPIKKEWSKLPVEAFAFAPLLLNKEDK